MVKELHAAVGQNRGQSAGMSRHVGHLAASGSRAAGKPGQIHRIVQASRQVFKVKRFGVRGEGQGMGNQSSGPHGSQEPLSPRLALSGPEDLGHRPAGQGPGELLVGGKIAALVDQIQGVIGHRRPVSIDNATGEVGEADVEMRLRNHDHLLEPGPLRDIFGPRRQGPIGQACDQKDSRQAKT